MPRFASSLLSRIALIKNLNPWRSSSARRAKPPPPPSLLDGLSAISHVLVVVVASNLASGSSGFETRLFITLRRQLLEYHRPAAILAAATPVPVSRKESEKTRSICDDEAETASQYSSVSTLPSLVCDDEKARPFLSYSRRAPTPSRARSTGPPSIPRRSSSLGKVFDAQRIKLVVSGSAAAAAPESRGRSREVSAARRMDFDACIDSKMRKELDPGMWLRSGRVAARGSVM